MLRVVQARPKFHGWAQAQGKLRADMGKHTSQKEKVRALGFGPTSRVGEYVRIGK